MKDFIARKVVTISKRISRSMDPRRYYVFAGPPGSGKTVYFVCATDRLQRFALENEADYTFTEENEDTLRFRRQALRRMSEGSWPDKTQGVHRLGFELIKNFRLSRNTWTLLRQHSCISYCDCDGTAFDQAFGDSRVAVDAIHSEAVQRLREELDVAHGIFLIIDTPQFHDNASDEAYQRLFNLFKHIEQSAHPKKIAVIFTKKDVFSADPEFNPKQRLKDAYPAAWNHLQRIQSDFFFVSAVKNPEVNHDGCPVPTRGYTTEASDSLLEPLRWMLGL